MSQESSPKLEEEEGGKNTPESSPSIDITYRNRSFYGRRRSK